jgi:hypothetical protein
MSDVRRREFIAGAAAAGATDAGTIPNLTSSFDRGHSPRAPDFPRELAPVEPRTTSSGSKSISSVDGSAPSMRAASTSTAARPIASIG